MLLWYANIPPWVPNHRVYQEKSVVSTLCTTLYNFESFIIFPVELFDLSKLDCQNNCSLLVKGRNVIINKNSVTTIKEFYVLNS